MTDPSPHRYQSVVGATVAGITERFRKRPQLALSADDRLDGRQVLVTGASRGLGLGIAKGVAALGASTWLGARSRRDEAVAEVRSAAGHDRVRALPLELTDTASLRALVAKLAEDGVQLDVLVLNAGVVPKEGRASAAGLDLMFHVNFLANVALVDALLAAGVLQPRTHDGRRPRVVIVGSEAHRSAGPLDLDSPGSFTPYGTSKVLAKYGDSKRYLHTWAVELGRRLAEPAPGIAVHHLCPGAVASDIAREAPTWSRPLLGVVMRAMFQSPDRAATPAIWLAASGAIDDRTGVYLHLTEEKQTAEETRDPAVGARLWEVSHALLAERGLQVD